MESEGQRKEVEKGKHVRLPVFHRQRFRLVRPPKDDSSSPDIASTVIFRLLQLPAYVEPSSRDDVCCWSVILHLVRREVYRRCGRLLAAGRIFFIIAARGAHVYDANKENFEELRTRDPYLDVSPELIIETERGFFDMAQNFEQAMVRVK